MSKFCHKGRAVLKAITPRNSPNDDTHVSLTLKIAATDVKIENVTAALGTEYGDLARACFFNPHSGEEETHFVSVHSIVSAAEWEGKHTLQVNGTKKLRVYVINRVQIRPRGKGRCDATFFALLESPPDGYFDQLKQALNHEVRIDLQQDGELENVEAGEEPQGDLLEGSAQGPISEPKKPKVTKDPKPAKKSAKKAPAKKAARKSIAAAAADSKPEPRSDSVE